MENSEALTGARHELRLPVVPRKSKRDVTPELAQLGRIERQRHAFLPAPVRGPDPAHLLARRKLAPQRLILGEPRSDCSVMAVAALGSRLPIGNTAST
ncbi:hypothetical protein WL71_32685 [Burkholderia ubonensis]|uniref:Uncharacterized protein n=1 Tax=Burkholderia ubonensis TaxID=101571 RepID=A0A125FZF0_9BURK|nr:hypothetical protein WL71_32685 [Burkholderia ubonensis]KWD74596.1 hypothetical protein WL70_26445 [Burkholderia ubonensis]KWD94030.1 hypothetical protein WL72_00120 [Burkholderia ubonensis]KWE07579.1 hypothetical protein WL73_09065 [Burkholderia ubonensis]